MVDLYLTAISIGCDVRKTNNRVGVATKEWEICNQAIFIYQHLDVPNMENLISYTLYVNSFDATFQGQACRNLGNEKTKTKIAMLAVWKPKDLLWFTLQLTDVC